MSRHRPHLIAARGSSTHLPRALTSDVRAAWLRAEWVVGAAAIAAMLICGGASGCRPGTPARTVEREADAARAGRSPAAWHTVEELPGRIAQFETVFWEPDDTLSLRELIRRDRAAEGRRVLEIGTGTGLVALCCLQAGATQVVATDINPNAVANARYNAGLLGLSSRLDVRQVTPEVPGAFAVLEPGERFDLIVSNPPWERGRPAKIDDFALYDDQFALLESLLQGLSERLRPEGRALLAYGCVEAIHQVLLRAESYSLDVQLLDDRQLDQLPPVFLPGMLLEVRPRHVELRGAP